MKKLLSIEYTKLKKLNSLRIILLSYIALLPLMMLFWSFVLTRMPVPGFPKESELYSFPTIWTFITFSASCLNVLVGVTIVIIVHNEMLFRTMKQNLIDGLSKMQVVQSKLIVVVGMAILVTGITFLAGLLIGGFYSGFNGWYYNIHAVFAYFLQAIAYFTFAFFIAVVIRKAAIAIILFVVIFPLETIIGWILDGTVSRVPYQFFPLNVFSKMTPLPFLEKMVSYEAKGKAVWLMPTWGIYLLMFGYLILFFVIAYRTLKRRDI